MDTWPRLRLLRFLIILQHVIVAAAYAVFLAMFLRRQPGRRQSGAWPLFGLVTALSAALNVSTIAISIAVERDWATTIAQGDSEALTTLNTYLRRIDLLTKLLAPLFVSMLSTAVSYTFSAAFMLGFALVTMIFEFWWIEIVYRRFPILHEEEQGRLEQQKRQHEEHKAVHNSFTSRQLFIHRFTAARPNFRLLAIDWVQFVQSPVFPSSLSISLLYFTVLSFDGTFIAYLKAHNYSVSATMAVWSCHFTHDLRLTFIPGPIHSRTTGSQRGDGPDWHDCNAARREKDRSRQNGHMEHHVRFRYFYNAHFMR